MCTFYYEVLMNLQKENITRAFVHKHTRHSTNRPNLFVISILFIFDIFNQQRYTHFCPIYNYTRLELYQSKKYPAFSNLNVGRIGSYVLFGVYELNLQIDFVMIFATLCTPEDRHLISTSAVVSSVVVFGTLMLFSFEHF